MEGIWFYLRFRQFTLVCMRLTQVWYHRKERLSLLAVK
jgi:hypothetical protein